MDHQTAFARASLWRTNPNTRPTPSTVRDVAGALVDRIAELEAKIRTLDCIATGRQVFIHRGNPSRGPETGPGFGRYVPAIVIDALRYKNQVLCRLLEDDPHAVGAPCKAGDEGCWAPSQVVTDKVQVDDLEAA